MGELRRSVGLLRALRHTRIRALVWPEGVVAAVLGFGGSELLVRYGDLELRRSIAADALVVLAPLLGVVLAALTIVIAVSSDDYVRLLSKAEDGVKAFYRPFIVAIGLEISAILLVIGYRASAELLISPAESWVFRLSCFLVVFAIVDVLAVGRNVVMHALTRARLLGED